MITEMMITCSLHRILRNFNGNFWLSLALWHCWLTVLFEGLLRIVFALACMHTVNLIEKMLFKSMRWGWIRPSNMSFKIVDCFVTLLGVAVTGKEEESGFR